MTVALSYSSPPRGQGVCCHLPPLSEQPSGAWLTILSIFEALDKSLLLGPSCARHFVCRSDVHSLSFFSLGSYCWSHLPPISLSLSPSPRATFLSLFPGRCLCDSLIPHHHPHACAGNQKRQAYPRVLYRQRGKELASSAKVLMSSNKALNLLKYFKGRKQMVHKYVLQLWWNKSVFCTWVSWSTKFTS